MDFVFIGAGNVGTQLALNFYRKGHNILQLFSRTEKSAKALADKVNASYTSDIKTINKHADAYFYCVKDNILSEIISSCHLPDTLHIHTSGSTSIDVFNGFYNNAGVVYPLQTFSKDRAIDISEVPFFIEGNQEVCQEKIFRIISILSDKIYLADSESRKKLHISAVFVCNFVNHMYEVGEELILDAGFSFDVLYPLMKETLQKTCILSPYDAQTGPALRNDTTIIKEHEQMLKNKRNLAEIYTLISEDIFNIHHNKK